LKRLRASGREDGLKYNRGEEKERKERKRLRIKKFQGNPRHSLCDRVVQVGA